jgi:hypothetical protein
MEEHRREEHGYVCSICQSKFAEWSDIKNHTLNEHGGYLTSETNSGRLSFYRFWRSAMLNKLFGWGVSLTWKRKASLMMAIAALLAFI